MKIPSKYIAILSAAILLGACAAPGFKATHDYDDTVNFSGYQTFTWVSQNPMKISSSNA